MLFDLGAGQQVVAVSRYDTYPPEVRSLPKVGGLLDPDYEAILRLAPDLVVTYGSQSELQRRLSAGRIAFYSYRHSGVEGTLQTMREMGVATGHAAEGVAAAERLRRQLDSVRARVRGLERPRTLLVFGRERGTLRQIYASGGAGFEHEILEMAGGVNVFADARRESVQPSIEMLLARAPEVIVELHSGEPPDAATIKTDHEVWTRLSAVPAVRAGRVQVLYADYLSIPGPRLGQMAEAIARALHPQLQP
jgi:iron complex transport system substrate-binding protein